MEMQILFMVRLLRFLFRVKKFEFVLSAKCHKTVYGQRYNGKVGFDDKPVKFILPENPEDTSR
jgi:hypothetical protein